MKPQKLFRYLAPEPVNVSVGERLRSVFAAFVAMLAVTAASSLVLEPSALPLVSASMGASAVLLFALPGSPLAQPWPFVGSHLIAAVIGVACALWVPDLVLAAALAVSLSLLAMFLTHTVHPPGGATALLPVVLGETARASGFEFVLMPVAVNVVLVLAMALVVNKLVLRRRYPARPFEAEDELHHHADPKSLDRVGITHDDLHQALVDLDVFVDVSEEDLNRIYRTAGMHAYRRRMGEITVKDVMSRDVIAVGPDAHLEEAWERLRHHKVKILPVVDLERRVLGIVSLVDVLKHAELTRCRRFEDKLIRFMRHTLGVGADTPRRVREVMMRPVVTVSEQMHIAEIVPLLSDAGYHHLPVVNARRRLTGIIIQSDLIAALYAGSLENLKQIRVA